MDAEPQLVASKQIIFQHYLALFILLVTTSTHVCLKQNIHPAHRRHHPVCVLGNMCNDSIIMYLYQA